MQGKAIGRLGRHGEPQPVAPPDIFRSLLANAIKFAGEYKDPSGLYRIGERYFDPDRGVWTQEDPIVQHNAYGTYSYANSDPVNNVDPSGLIPFPRALRCPAGYSLLGFACRPAAVWKAVFMCVTFACRYVRINLPRGGYVVPILYCAAGAYVSVRVS